MTRQSKEKIRAYKKAWYQKNREQRIAYMRAYRKANKKKLAAKKKISNEVNKEKLKAYQREYYKKNKEKRKAYKKIWNKANPEKLVARGSRYHSQMLNAIPPWLTPEMEEQILAKYKEARALSESSGISYHVDHIIPLQGKEVRGLHVPWNLQVIPAVENLKKNNILL